MSFRLLDTPFTRLYKSRALWLTAVLLATGARAESVNGAQVPDGALIVGENRYRASDDFEGVLKYYKTVYPPANYPRKSVINQPGIKAVHIVNPSGKNFEGLNIYEANEEVRIYVIPANAPPSKKKDPKSKRKS
ncbi:MAG: hypothetical protein ACT4TC_08140 [Myxococcaceae bacterium]